VERKKINEKREGKGTDERVKGVEEKKKVEEKGKFCWK